MRVFEVVVIRTNFQRHHTWLTTSCTSPYHSGSGPSPADLCSVSILGAENMSSAVEVVWRRI